MVTDTVTATHTAMTMVTDTAATMRTDMPTLTAIPMAKTTTAIPTA